MVRAPCCEKMGLKKGPWTPEEDRILIDYINQFGHGNWRALPKQAGLLRCGKSCRLRWTNYLRPDIKRGNFTKEEEEAIIKLHQILGNRWSAIAAKLPGRTDNEIKNVWHTHLKKRLQKNQTTAVPNQQHPFELHVYSRYVKENELRPTNDQAQLRPESPQHSSSEASSLTTTTDVSNNLPAADEKFWSDVFFAENSGEYPPAGGRQVQTPFFPAEQVCGYNPGLHDHMEFWYNLFRTAGDQPELPNF